MKYDEYHFDPSSEYTPPAKEYPSVEKQQQQKDKKKRTRRRFLLMLSAFVCSGAILFSEPVPAQEPAPQPTPIVVEASSPVPTHTPKPTPEPTEEPSVPLPTAALYPLNGGTLYLSVYGDAFDFETFDNLLLAREEIAIAQFDQGYAYSLPACPPQEGFLFMGYVLCSGGEGNGAYFKLGDSITASELALIPPENEAGDRTVEVHAAWRTLQEENYANIIRFTANGGTIEGESTVEYDAVMPLYSEGLVYLCAYPVPQREGYTFAGWYYDNEPVEILRSDAFFPSIINEDGFPDHDWRNPHSIELTARWVKNP